MYLRFLWIVSRRRKLVASLIDFLINLTLYNFIFFSDLKTYPNKLVSLSIAFFWIVLSYVLGRYTRIKEISFKTFTKSLIKVIFIVILCNLIYLIINLGLPIIFYWDRTQLSNYLSKDLSNIFIKSSLLIAIISIFIQYSLSIITYNIYDQKKEWFFYGKELKYRQIIEEIGSNKKDLNIYFISDKDSLEFINPDKIKGIIIEDLHNINKENLDIIFELKIKGVIIESLITWFENEFHRIPTNIIENKYQLVEKLKSIEDSYQIRTKRIGDLFVSLILLIITSPLFILISFLIYIEDRGPLFYKQVRTGLNGQKINIIKFRSMKIDAEKNGVQWSKKIDPRVTRIGKIIRATRIDELPQLFCVINGTMSLIGPRPERPEIESQLLKNIPYYNCRNILRPGISGWAQVNYPYGASIFDTTKKLSFDIYYISHFSIFLDLLILFKTIKLVLNARGSKPKI